MLSENASFSHSDSQLEYESQAVRPLILYITCIVSYYLKGNMSGSRV